MSGESRAHRAHCFSGSHLSRNSSHSDALLPETVAPERGPNGPIDRPTREHCPVPKHAASLSPARKKGLPGARLRTARRPGFNRTRGETFTAAVSDPRAYRSSALGPRRLIGAAVVDGSGRKPSDRALPFLYGADSAGLAILAGSVVYC
ncbi:hypothetical protein MRX96_005347 [Rhipicephalus microplus]